MSLRQINRDREGRRGGSPFGFGKKHFSKLQKHDLSGKHIAVPRKDILPLVIIAIIVVGVISFELYLWSSSPQEVVDEPIPEANITTPTPLVVNETPVAKPDLELTSLTLSAAEAELEHNLTITAKIKNNGEVDTDNFTVAFYVGDEQIESLTADVQAGQTLELKKTWSPAEKHLGKQNIRVVADVSDTIDESLENNNEKGVTIDVIQPIIEDISDTFEKKSTMNFVNQWYSDKFMVPPEGGSDYTYFQLSRAETDLYYLDIVIPGFRATSLNNILQIEIPDATDGGWNGRQCVKQTVDSETCIWSGPRLTFKIDFDGSKMKVIDGSGRTDSSTTSDKKVSKIKLGGMRVADWPGELRTYRVTGAPQPDAMVPTEFYEISGDTIFVHPMRWNPRSYKADVTTWLRFEITTS